MKIMIATTPIRPRPTNFPPLGSLTLLNYLRKNGYGDVELFNIDGLRPDYEQVLKRIAESKPDIFGISAVVSTAYAYTKRLAEDVRRLLPDTLIVLGGNMGASAEILLRKTEVDSVILGEGESVLLNFCRRAEQTRAITDFHDIAGLCYLDDSGNLVNTGYEPQLPKEELYDVDWTDLDLDQTMDLYFPDLHGDPTGNDHLRADPRFWEEKRRGKRMVTIYTAKGCVSRCTFCHRWDKGIRFIPVDIVIARLKHVIENYNVGILHLADENFGTDRRWLKEFCEKIKELDILWFGGTRAAGMTPEIVEMIRDAGCVAIIYGNETGSDRMLEVMEKKVTIEQNYNAVKWAIDGGLSSRVQLVLGMPGESPETIAETIEFCQFTNSISQDQNPNDLSINYAQALPGTPLYEFGRSRNLIGRSVDDEEAYLLNISDRDAHDEYTTLNFTDYPKLVCETWRPLITVSVNHYFAKKFGLENYHRVFMRDVDEFSGYSTDSGYYANPKRLMEQGVKNESGPESEARYPGLWHLVKSGQWGLALIAYPMVAYRYRALLPMLVLLKNFREAGLKSTLSMLGEFISYEFRRLAKGDTFAYEYKSLRKIVDKDIGTLPGDLSAMVPLRKGR